MGVTFDPPSIPLARDSATIRVVRYNPDAPTGFFKPLPNIVCVAVQFRDGDSLPSARFRYQFVSGGDPRYPSRVEDIIGADKNDKYIIKQDDRLCVLKDDSDGGYTILFDGFAQVPQVDLGKETESATFEAIGVAVREWDTPIGGATFRDLQFDTSVYADTFGDAITYRATRFNPDGVPNAVPNGDSVDDTGFHAPVDLTPYYSGSSADRKYPVFLDAMPLDGTGNRIGAVERGYWTIAGAAKYLLRIGNPKEKYVTLPDFTSLDDILSSKSPTKGDSFNPSDPASTSTYPIRCQDFDATGEPWPTALEKLIRPHGFDFSFTLDQGGTGRPVTTLSFFRIDDADNIAPKSCYLQAAGATYDPAKSNVAALGITRDSSKIANQIVIDTELVRYECSVVLTPKIAPLAADLVTADTNKPGLDKYLIGNPNNVGDDYERYRVYVVNEINALHGGSYEYMALPVPVVSDGIFKPILGAPENSFARHLRPGLNQLFTTKNGKKQTAQLWMSTAYNGTVPGVWDGTATDWQLVNGGQWELLKDQLGVRITCLDLESLTVTQKSNPTGPAKADKFRLISSQANISNATGTGKIPRVVFRLTCVIEGDQNILGTTATRRAASLSPYAITRRVDCRDWFAKHIIDKSSHFNTTGKPILARDDTAKATAFAAAMRAANENAKFAGSITIPRITTAYKVGDKIDVVKGREISLRANTGRGTAEAPEYPVVVAISWDFDGHQRTTIQLSDRRAEPSREFTH